jgi:phosphoribosyl 1,2-cyclic phosphate phosphodiesterase
MDITILGSGGNTPIPMPTCQCDICIEARNKGEPYARRGNSIFIHDENIMIDAPELAWHSLNRENIEEVDYIFISHFHFDHWLGLRTLQAIGSEEQPIDSWSGDLPTLVMSQATYDKTVEENPSIKNLVEKWSKKIKILNDGDEMQIGDLHITSIGAEIHPGEGNEIFSFLIEKDGKKALISPDETKFLEVSKLPNLDLWIRETGLFEKDPQGNRIMTEEAWKEDTQLEITFQETLEHIREAEAEKVVLTEIEEIFQRSYDDYKELEKEHENLNIKFANDGMTINL